MLVLQDGVRDKLALVVVVGVARGDCWSGLVAVAVKEVNHIVVIAVAVRHIRLANLLFLVS